jgi:transcriptional regulator with XRE-family HTH domain
MNMVLVNKKAVKPKKDKDLWLKQLGLKIKEFRQKAGMSQADLAYSIQMDAQNISRIERGLVNPSAYAVKQICEALGISIADFYLSF